MCAVLKCICAELALILLDEVPITRFPIGLTHPVTVKLEDIVTAPETLSVELSVVAPVTPNVPPTDTLLLKSPVVE